MNNKVVLVIPKDSIGMEPLVYPPLGILYIASTLENAGFNIEIYDMRDEKNTLENIPDSSMYGFTAVTAQIKFVEDISRVLRLKGKYTVLGGPSASWMSSLVKENFDAVVIGEAEYIVVDVFRNKMSGVIDANKYNKDDIDSIRFPARHLMSRERITTSELWEGYGFGKGPKATTIITSRGCPWRCAFCANITQKVRFRGVLNIVQEINELVEKYDCKKLKLLDDNFLMNRNRLRDMMVEFNKLGVEFRCNSRANSLNDELCEHLSIGGCCEVGLGVETVDDLLLAKINKQERVEHFKTAIRRLKKHGIRTKVFLLLGIPGETWETVQKIKDFILEVEPDKWIVSLFTPYPGCDMWNNPEKYGFEILNRDWSSYHQTFPSRSVIQTKDVSNIEFEEHHKCIIEFLENYKRDRNE